MEVLKSGMLNIFEMETNTCYSDGCEDCSSDDCRDYIVKCAGDGICPDL